MPVDPKPASRWRRLIALFVASLLALTVLVATRGPDRIGAATAETAGGWMLSGPSLWHTLAPLGAMAETLFLMAGPRGWQNAHVIIAWLALVCWLLGLPPRSWRGLLPVIPAVLAAVLASPLSGFSGFGAAVLVLSLWRVTSVTGHAAMAPLSFPVAAWLAAWLSPGAVLVLPPFLVETSPRVSGRKLAAAAAAALVAVNLTPRGASVWPDAMVFLLWTPQAAPDAPAVIAILAGMTALAFAARASWHSGQNGRALAPLWLLLCASWGQTAFLWVASLTLIPCWPAAKEQLARWGVRIRWWTQAALVAGSIALAAWPCVTSVPGWYDLVMTSAAVQPTLTRDALPADAPVFINTGGLATARMSGKLPSGFLPPPTLEPFGREPGLWRAADRRHRYQAVWLLGDKSDFAPLARHLGESKDWRLEAVDATGMLFIRKPEAPEFATEPAQQFARALTGAVNKSGFLSAAALSCLAAGAVPEAGELSATAVKRSDRSSSTAATRALVLISLGLVRPALDESLRAVRLNPNSAEAWRVRTEALLHAGMADDAYAAARRAADLDPGDPGTLWLFARAANAARAFQTESEVLERLIALTVGRHGDAGFYQFYLGQAYAKQGLLRPALTALETAAAAPGLTDDQRREIRDEIRQLQDPVGSD
jgi:hypothetical protein